jgi:hypothetical protein
MGGDVPVALVHMPFADTTYPSLGLSLLKALLAAEAITAERTTSTCARRSCREPTA